MGIMSSTSFSTIAPYLADEIVFFILVRLPVKSLLRFTCVCKLWYNIIRNHPNFTAEHFVHANAKNPPTLLAILQSQRKKNQHHKYFINLDHPYNNNQGNCSTWMMDSWSTFIGNSNGLICLRTPFGDVEIFNPSTCEFLSLPIGIRLDDPGDIPLFGFYGFGFDALKNEYKVVRFCNRNKCVVFTLGTNSWRDITLTSNLPPYCFPFRQYAPILSHGALHWFVTDANIIVSFDIHSEKFQVIPVPHYPLDKTHQWMFELRGCLCLAFRHENFRNEVHINLFMLKDYHQQQSWVEKTFFFPMKPSSPIQISSISEQMLAYWVSDGQLILYNLLTGDENSVKLERKKYYQHYALINHVENLFSLRTLVPSGETEVIYVNSTSHQPKQRPSLSRFISSRRSKHSIKKPGF